MPYMDPAYLAVLALKLAILTFYLGVLVYALPIPLPMVKRWGPQLVWDSLVSLLLVALYATLYSLSSRIALLLGGSWTLFNVWYTSSLGVTLSLKTFLASLTAIPEISRFLGVISAIVTPLDRAATLAILFLTTIGGIAELVYNYGLILITVGLVLYALPLRIARGAGAWLIAFILVFNIGLQILPIFLSSLATPPQVPEASIDYRLLSIKVTSSNGHPIAYGFLEIRDNEGTLALYKLDGSGLAKSKLLEGDQVVVPAKTVSVYLEYDGILFPLEPSPLRPQDYPNGYRITLRAPHIVLSRYPLIVVYTSTEGSEVEEGDNWFSIKTSMNPGDYIEIRYPNYCNLSISSNLTPVTGSWEWRGVSGSYYRFEASTSGSYHILVQISGCNSPILPSDDGVRDYLEELMKRLSFIDLNLLKAFILYYLTIPSIYIFILFLATGALARVLGGRDRIPVRVA